MIGIGLAHDLLYLGSSLIRTQQDNTTSEMIKPSPNRSVTPIILVSRRRHIFRMVADSHAPWRMICWSRWNQSQGLYSVQRDRANGYDRRYQLRTPDSLHERIRSTKDGGVKRLCASPSGTKELRASARFPRVAIPVPAMMAIEPPTPGEKVEGEPTRPP
jgi:hypothetical protein